MEIPDEVIAAARAHVPAWLRWTVPGAWLVLVGLATFAGTRLAIVLPLRRFRRSAGEHWTERARQAWTVLHATLGSFLLAATLGSLVAWMLGGPLALISTRLLVFLTILTVMSGASLATRHLKLLVTCEPASEPPRLRSRFVGWFLGRTVLLIPALVVISIPLEWGPRAIGILAASTLLMAWFLHGGASRLLEIAGLARDVPAWISELVESSAERAGTPAPRTRLLDIGIANAWVIPSNRTLFVTAPLLEVLDREGLATVVAHEIGHLTEPRRVLWMRCAPLYLLALLPAAIPLGMEYGPLPPIALLALWFVVTLATRRMARRMEYRADHAALRQETDAGAFARALERIHERNLAPVVLFGRGGTHPHLYDRLLAAGILPAYPRPRPPPRLPGATGIVLGAIAWLAPAFAVVSSSVLAWARVGAREGGHRIALAISGGDPWFANAWAEQLRDRGKLKDAYELARYARAADPADLNYSADFISLCILRGRLDEARAELQAMRVLSLRGDAAVDPLPAAWLARTCSDLGMKVEARLWIEDARRVADVLETRSELEAYLLELGIDSL